MKAQVFTVEDARIGFKNFAGEPGPYNKEGDRDFAIMLDNEELVSDLIAQGYNVKPPKPRPDINPEDDTRVPYLSVKVGDKVTPLLIRQDLNGNEINREYIPNEEIGMLDWLSPATMDVTVRPFDYSEMYSGGTGISAWLNEIVYIIEMSPLELKYAKRN